MRQSRKTQAMKKIKEIIVVEGRDDTTAINRAVDALTIETHGFGIRPETWQLIETAYNTSGIIVFTDPDHAGEQIRRRILQKFPKAKEAFLDVKDAEKKGDIGIENAEPEAIIEALEKAHSSIDETVSEVFTGEDMSRWGLTGAAGASERRNALAKKLGIGYANSKTFLQRLNKFGISRETIEEAIKEL